MNVKQVLATLEGMGGWVWWTDWVGPDGALGWVSCRSVEHLRVDERVLAGGGNVILWNGKVDQEERMDGVVFWARDLVEITWEGEERVVMRGKTREAVFIRGERYETGGLVSDWVGGGS